MFKNLRAYGNILRAYGHILRAYGDQTPLITATSAPIETGHPPCKLHTFPDEPRGIIFGAEAKKNLIIYIYFSI